MMTDAGMSQALKTELENVYTILDEAQLQKFCDAAGKAIVEYIKANAVVPAGISVTTSGGNGATDGTGTVT